MQPCVVVWFCSGCRSGFPLSQTSAWPASQHTAMPPFSTELLQCSEGSRYMTATPDGGTLVLERGFTMCCEVDHARVSVGETPADRIHKAAGKWSKLTALSSKMRCSYVLSRLVLSEADFAGAQHSDSGGWPQADHLAECVHFLCDGQQGKALLWQPASGRHQRPRLMTAAPLLLRRRQRRRQLSRRRALSRMEMTATRRKKMMTRKRRRKTTPVRQPRTTEPGRQHLRRARPSRCPAACTQSA